MHKTLWCEQEVMARVFIIGATTSRAQLGELPKKQVGVARVTSPHAEAAAVTLPLHWRYFARSQRGCRYIAVTSPEANAAAVTLPLH